GKKVTPAIVKSVEHKDRTIEMPDPIGERVISREAADTVTSVLTGVVNDGTAKRSVRENPLRDGQQVAGKTGTSDDNLSAWFTGFTPNLVTSVGLFGEDDKTQDHVPMYKAAGVDYRVNGGGPPAEIWAAYTFGVMEKVTKFDLETKQGAAVKPSKSATTSQSPSQSPSHEETTEAPPPSDDPTTEAPPSNDPTTEEPPESPTQSPSNSASSGETPPDGGGSTESGDPEFPGGDWVP
ncbi:penicillin-binding transpeptidase domain-containing protein, partial [Streptomyces sp. ICN988]|uniref:penicillin-binding transpeptidase domain-containing protein n=1 Tax=Streptomyces sp. ICN988 TaxID=2983765 RepID=UPI0021E4531E